VDHQRPELKIISSHTIASLQQAYTESAMQLDRILLNLSAAGIRLLVALLAAGAANAGAIVRVVPHRAICISCRNTYGPLRFSRGSWSDPIRLIHVL